MSEVGFPIKMAARLSGLTEHVIRVWEKRYAAVTPGRSTTRRRLYSEDEITRLTLLRQVTGAGHSISSVVRLSEHDLRRLVPESPAEALPAGRPVEALTATLESAYAAVTALDAAGLERILHTALVGSGRAVVTSQLLVPLIHRIGEAWHEGELRIAHEHAASAVIRTFLGNFVRSHSDTSNAPVLVVTTPAGQLHELGAMLAAAAATDMGWRVTYLGPNLPAEEIAGAYRQNQAQALALSIVYPGDDPGMASQLRHLREFLPERALIFAGGRAAAGYRKELDSIEAVLCDSTADLAKELARLRLR